MFAIVSKESRPKVIIFVEKNEVSKGEWGCRIQTKCVASLTTCAVEIWRVPNHLLSELPLYPTRFFILCDSRTPLVIPRSESFCHQR